MIPTNLKYQSKVESASSRRYRTNLSPQNGQNYTNAGGNTIIINIPTRNNTALIPSESVLKGTLSFTIPAGNNAISACFDSCGAHGLINRLRVFHGSNLLQDEQSYNELAKILYDFQMPLDSTQGRYSVNSGTTNEYAGSFVGADLPAIQANGLIVKPVNRGRNFIAQNATSANLKLDGGSTHTYDFSINLISLVGSLAGNKYLPLWNMTSAPLRVELVLQAGIQGVMCMAPTSATPANYNLSNVEFIGEFLELPDSAISAINAGSSNPMQMVFPDFRAYTYSQLLGTAQTTVSMPIPAKFSSLKSIFVNSKLTTGASGAEGRYPTGSQNFNLSSYSFRIGSETLPSTPCTTIPDFFNEACKCFGSLADASYQPSIDIDSYNVLYTQGAINDYLKSVSNNSGSFLIGIDLETYQNTDKSSIFAGMNTNTSDIFFQPVHGGLNGATQCYYTAFANYDCVLVMESGTAYVRY